MKDNDNDNNDGLPDVMVEQVVTVAQAHIPALLLISPSKDV